MFHGLTPAYLAHWFKVRDDGAIILQVVHNRNFCITVKTKTVK